MRNLLKCDRSVSSLGVRGTCSISAGSLVPSTVVGRRTASAAITLASTVALRSRTVAVGAPLLLFWLLVLVGGWARIVWVLTSAGGTILALSLRSLLGLGGNLVTSLRSLLGLGGNLVLRSLGLGGNLVISLRSLGSLGSFTVLRRLAGTTLISVALRGRGGVASLNWFGTIAAALWLLRSLAVGSLAR